MEIAFETRELRALVMNPTLLLCDEPFGALDALTRAEMQEELLDIWNRKGMTAVFITHDIDEAVLLSDRVLVMGGKNGNVNPSTILADLQVPLKRPRDRLTVQSERSFLVVTQKIWEMIHKMRG